MPVQVPAEGVTKLLSTMLSGKIMLRLFDDAESLSEPTRSSGYLPIPLVRSDWTIAPGDPAVAQSAEKVFQFFGAGRVSGYFLTYDGIVLCSEGLKDPVDIRNRDLIAVAPRITLESGVSSVPLS